MRERGREPLGGCALAIVLTAVLFGPAPLFSFPFQETESAALVPRPAAYFVENAGQLARDDIRYYTAAGDVRAAFTDSGVLLKLSEPGALSADPRAALDGIPTRQAILRLTFEGGANVVPEALDPGPTRNHFFLGNDPTRWQRDVRSFGTITYENLYEGIDLVYRTDGAGLKYEFLVHPGGDPARIAIRYEGTSGLSIDPAGDLVAATALGPLRDTAPRSFQGTQEVSCRFALRAADTAGFACDSWNRRETLVIDPLVYSTYLGGSRFDYGFAVTTDSSGNAYVVGYTDSMDFPVGPGIDVTFNFGQADVFVTKLNTAAVPPALPVYSTYLGGGFSWGSTDWDFGYGIAVDSLGNAYVTGVTSSPNFPTTPGAPYTSLNGGGDAFVAKIDPTGSQLLYSTYLGGSGGGDGGYGIAVDAIGNAYVTGETNSGDFPVPPSAAQPMNAGGFSDAFVAVLGGSGVVLGGTYLGGTNGDIGYGIALDGFANAYVAGLTFSGDYPTTSGAFQTSLSGLYDAFLTKVSPMGTTIGYSTYVGGSNGVDVGRAVGVDSSGNAYLAGTTGSSDFPTTPGAYDTTPAGGDVYVTKFNAGGTALTFSTMISGNNQDFVAALALDAAGNALLTGFTASTDWPTTAGAYDTTHNGLDDAYVTKLSTSGSSLLYSTFYGGSGQDFGFGIAVDAAGDAYITGYTDSLDLPLTLGAVQSSRRGQVDALAARITTVVGGVPCRTQGYWKNHPAAWPVPSLTLGTTTYTQAQLLVLLGTPTKGDASLILAHQLIAAKLNVAAGSNPAAAASAISNADSLLAAYSGSLPYRVKPSGSAGQQMVAAASVLDDYNNGRLNPPC
ncbi:MAG TPA: SBBP repeat-containing protein [Thermoplasmata archaeon]|nr:SBBP repeat-containing protein [Thermoplasmata archaeon]